MDQFAASSQLVTPVGEHDHIQGPASAVVTMVEYGDYLCKNTREAYPVIKRIQQISGDWLRFVFRNYPRIDKHEFSEIAAEAAEAAGAQGMFWEMHDYLLNIQELDDALLMDYAEEIGLDLDKFESDLGSHAFKQQVLDVKMSGIKSGVTNTPTFFMNGVMYKGTITENMLLEAIEQVGEEVEEEE